MTKSEFLFEKLQIEKPWHLDLDDFDAKTFLVRFRELHKDEDIDIWVDVDNDLNWISKLFNGNLFNEFKSLDFKNCIIEALLYFYNYEHEVDEWQNKCLENFAKNIANQYDPPPGSSELVDKHFWDLLKDEK